MLSHIKSQPFFSARKAGGRDTKRADVIIRTDSDTENGHNKAQWVHLWSVHGYTVNRLLMYPAALRSTTSGIGIFFILKDYHIRLFCPLKKHQHQNLLFSIFFFIEVQKMTEFCRLSVEESSTPDLKNF